MNVYRRYFRVTSGPLIEEIDKTQKIIDSAFDRYLKILEEIGAEPQFYHIDNRLSGIIFKELPNSGLYKATKHGWYPKKNCKAGKELATRIESIETADMNDCLSIVNLSRRPSIFHDGRCHMAVLTVIPETPPVAYISVPWYDEDPEVIEQYKKDKADRKHLSSNLDSILWEPHADMQEIKKWEQDRHIDEYNESLKAAHPNPDKED